LSLFFAVNIVTANGVESRFVEWRTGCEAASDNRGRHQWPFKSRYCCKRVFSWGCIDAASFVL